MYPCKTTIVSHSMTSYVSAYLSLSILDFCHNFVK